MGRFTLHLTRAVITVAIAAMPLTALAQSSSPNPAADHLRAARTALNKVLNTPAPAGEAFKKLSELKTEYIALEKAASTRSPEWAAHYTVIERLVGELLGPMSVEPGAVGTSGRAGAAAKALDPAIASGLTEFRTELAAFSAAMKPAVAPAPTPAPAPAPAAATAPPATPPPSAPPVGTDPVSPPPAAVAPPVGAPPVATPPAAAAAGVPLAPPSPSPAVADAQIDQLLAVIDSALAMNPQATSVTIDRVALEQIKAQLKRMPR